MAILKFRAWNAHEKKIFTNVQIIVWNGNVYANDNSELNVNNLKGWSIDEKYLMQSTGLADENGKEIFEGDIIQTERYFDGFTDVKLYKGVVKQLEGLWMIDTGNDAVPVFSEIEENIVIGNIYENPELMEEDK